MAIEKIMATVSAKVFEHHKKADGTYNVKICVQHKSERMELQLKKSLSFLVAVP